MNKKTLNKLAAILLAMTFASTGTAKSQEFQNIIATKKESGLLKKIARETIEDGKKEFIDYWIEDLDKGEIKSFAFYKFQKIFYYEKGKSINISVHDKDLNKKINTKDIIIITDSTANQVHTQMYRFTKKGFKVLPSGDYLKKLYEFKNSSEYTREKFCTLLKEVEQQTIEIYKSNMQKLKTCK